MKKEKKVYIWNKEKLGSKMFCIENIKHCILWIIFYKTLWVILYKSIEYYKYTICNLVYVNMKMEPFLVDNNEQLKLIIANNEFFEKYLN